jgi:4-hydroxybenzoyl-CoA reductase subunit alpha
MTSRVRVIKPFLGGGFGARTEALHFEIIAGLLARKARGTVRLLQTREETFLAHRGRPWTEVKMKIGLKKDGRITALRTARPRRPVVPTPATASSPSSTPAR